MSRLKIKIDAAQAQRKLALLEAAARNMQPAYATIGRALVRRVQLCFKLGIDPWGSPWAKLKIRRGQPLRDTGLLNRSITQTADAQGVTVGTNQVPRAPVHQYGATIVPKTAGGKLVFPGPGGRLIFAKKVTIPARPFLPIRKGQTTVALPVDWSADVVRALRSYFRNAVAKAL